MKRNDTYKAVAYEHSHGDDGYYMGEGVAFSNSIKNAIKAAKHRALNALGEEEFKAKDSGCSILATIEVYKNGKKIINDCY